MFGGNVMSEMLDKLEAELTEAREKVRARRRQLTGGVVEDAAVKAGRDTKEAVADTFEDLDEALARTTLAAKDYGARATERGGEFVDDLVEDIKETQAVIREKRRNLTGGHAEDALRDGLDEVEERISNLCDRVRKRRSKE
jgi:polyhydroxyalkanoate synthesis regulator phasin